MQQFQTTAISELHKFYNITIRKILNADNCQILGTKNEQKGSLQSLFGYNYSDNRNSTYIIPFRMIKDTPTVRTSVSDSA